MTETYLSICHHEDCLIGKQGWLISHVTDDGGWASTATYIDSPDDVRYAGLNFTEWPRSLWGYFESKEQALAAVKEAGLEHKLDSNGAP